jgi:hypothetical protein
MVTYDPSTCYVCVTYTPEFQTLLDNFCAGLVHPNIEIHANKAVLQSRYDGFRSSGWFECLKRKMQFFYDFMAALPSGAIACSIDADVQFFHPGRLVERKQQLEASDLMCYGQAEHHLRWIDKPNVGVANGGFFMLKKSALVMDWLNSVLVQNYNRRFLGDQEYLNHFLRQKRVPYYLLPPQEYIHGAPVSTNDTKFINRRKVVLHHATYAFKVEEKQAQMNQLRAVCGFPLIDWAAPSNKNSNVVHYVDGVASDPATASPPMPLPSKTKPHAIVLARYSEDVSWAARWATQFDVFVYNKGAQISPAFNGRWLSLPNVGREAHTYLSHIVDNYDNLHDVTIFLQGRIDDVHAYPATQLQKYIAPAAQHGFSASHLMLVQPPFWNNIDFLSLPKYAPQVRSGALRINKLGLLAYAHKYFGRLPVMCVSSYNGCFAASRAAILRHKREFYQTLLATVSDHDNPEEAHFLERLWAYTFSGTTYVPELLKIPKDKRDKFAF